MVQMHSHYRPTKPQAETGEVNPGHKPQGQRLDATIRRKRRRLIIALSQPDTFRGWHKRTHSVSGPSTMPPAGLAHNEPMGIPPSPKRGSYRRAPAPIFRADRKSVV